MRVVASNIGTGHELTLFQASVMTLLSYHYLMETGFVEIFVSRQQVDSLHHEKVSGAIQSSNKTNHYLIFSGSHNFVTRTYRKNHNIFEQAELHCCSDSFLLCHRKLDWFQFSQSRSLKYWNRTEEMWKIPEKRSGKFIHQTWHREICRRYELVVASSYGCWEILLL